MCIRNNSPPDSYNYRIQKNTIKFPELLENTHCSGSVWQVKNVLESKCNVSVNLLNNTNLISIQSKHFIEMDNYCVSESHVPWTWIHTYIF